MKKNEYELSDLFITSWGELTSRGQITKLMEYGEALMTVQPGTAAFGHLAIKVMRTLRKQRDQVAKLTLEQVVDCFNAIDFYHRDEAGNFKTPWLYFPVGAFRLLPLRKFTRPELIGGLPMYNRSFDQLVYADTQYSLFCFYHHQLTQADAGSILLPSPKQQLIADMEKSVCGLIAALYRDPEHFNPEHLERFAEAIPGALTKQERALILHTYANVRTFIINRYPNLFPRSAGAERDEAAATAPTSTGSMWMDLRYDLAETEAFKGLQTARSARIYDALDYLDKKALEASKHKTKQP